MGENATPEVTNDGATTPKESRSPARGLPLLLAGLVATSLIVGVSGVVLAVRADHRAQAVADDLSESKSEVQRLNDRLNASETRLDGLDGTFGTVAELTDRVDSVESDVTSVAEGAVQAISSLRSCINDYMDTVGRSGGGYYTYFYC